MLLALDLSSTSFPLGRGKNGGEAWLGPIDPPPSLPLYLLTTLGSHVLHVRRNMLDVHGSSLPEYNLLRKTYLTTALKVQTTV